MPGIRQITLTEPVANEVASNLRHDLITPINLVVGYCELLISEAEDLGIRTHLASLRAIRGLGFDLLHEIDRVLLTDRPERRIAEIREMATALEVRAQELVDSCDALAVAIGDVTDWGASADDLHKIRTAGVRMIEMARTLATGRFPTDCGTSIFGE